MIIKTTYLVIVGMFDDILDRFDIFLSSLFHVDKIVCRSNDNTSYFHLKIHI